MKARSGREIEVKLRVGDRAGLVRRLRELGARAMGARVLEKNVIYDTKSGRLKKRGLLLRVRTQTRMQSRGRGKPRPYDERKDGVVTLKMPTERGSGAGKKYKVREEKEWRTGDVRAVEGEFRRRGLRVTWRYEKYRTEYRLARVKGVVVAVDETPIGDFVELEGEPRAIDAAARMLGYGEGEYIRESYGALYLRERAKRGWKGREMVFGGR